MNRSFRKEKSHEAHRKHIILIVQVLRKTQPEEFDLVILGGGTGSTIAAWTFAGEAFLLRFGTHSCSGILQEVSLRF